MNIREVIDLRRFLHAHPELSGNEHATAAHLNDVLRRLGPDDLITGLGGTGLACTFDGHGPGPATVIRCELDALPINEANTFAHRSSRPGVSHQCGHDGHMAILVAVAARLAVRRPERGRVVLLFQPAEEIGSGAQQVRDDPRFPALEPAYVFALHNLPGVRFGDVQVRPGTMCCASRGIIIQLTGRSSHAAYPESGVSPAAAMCRVIEGLRRLPVPGGGLAMITVVHARLGEIAFGTAPGCGVVMATLRAETDGQMAELADSVQALARREAAADGLKLEISWQDDFAACVNSAEAVSIIAEACAGLGVPCSIIDQPFRWSEDFGRLAECGSGALFVLGAGEHAPQLHRPDYDFPDELISRGADLFVEIIRRVNGLYSATESSA